MLYEDITKEIIGAAQEVHRELGFGFLEAVYGNALYKELTRRGMKSVLIRAIRAKIKKNNDDY